MKINEIELSNFRQHKSKKFQLTGNLIGIVGPNGSGKSNFLKGIQYGLVGDVPDVTKDKLLSWGEKSGFVRMLVDNDTTIKRSVASNNAEIVNKGRKVTGIANVNNAVKDWYNIDKELAKQAIFVRQAEIDAILFDTPAKREQSFQKLCGMGNAATVNKKIGEIIYNRFQQPPNYDEQITVLKTKLQEDSARLETLLEEQKANVVNMSEEDITKLKLHIQAHDNLKRSIAQLQALAVSKDDLETKQAQVAVGLGKIPPVEDTSTLQNNILEAKELAQKAKRYEIAKANYDAKKAQEGTIGDEPVTQEQVDKLKNQYNELVEAYHKAQANYGFFKSLYDTVSKAGDLTGCPVCGSQVDPKRILDNLEKEITKYSNEVTKFSGDYDPNVIKSRIDQYTQEINNYNLARQRIVSAAQQAEDSLKSTEAVEIDMSKLLASIAEMEDFYSKAEQFKTAAVQLETQAKFIKDSYDKTIEDYTKLKASVDAEAISLNVDTSLDLVAMREYVNGQYIELSASLDTVINKTNENSRRAGIIDELNKTIKALEKNIEDLTKKREALKHFDSTISTLNNVKTWFHYSNGPRTLSSGIISDMLANINDFLSTLGAPFFVSPQVQEGLSFECVFQDGRTVDPDTPPQADDLSGGEKILLATSFRLASYCMFANQLGLLSLDEPTVYLDDKNVAKFCTFLEKVKEVAKTLDLQIFIATHERSVIPYMDTIIDLQ